jgi:hypothetical protein
MTAGVPTAPGASGRKVAGALVALVPAIYQYVIEQRIYSLYGQLKTLEAELEQAGPGPAPHDMTALEDLARRANHLSVPLRYSQRLFILRSHIALAKEQLQKRQSAVSPEAIETLSLLADDRGAGAEAL